MASTRNMLRALLFHLRTPPSAVLAQLDRTLEAITDNPVTTTSLPRIEPAGPAWRLHWSTAGHVPPLLITPAGGRNTCPPSPDYHFPGLRGAVGAGS